MAEVQAVPQDSLRLACKLAWKEQVQAGRGAGNLGQMAKPRKNGQCTRRRAEKKVMQMGKDRACSQDKGLGWEISTARRALALLAASPGSIPGQP